MSKRSRDRMMKLFFAVVTTLVIRINCQQLAPTAAQLACAAANNNDVPANCLSMQIMADPNAVCTNSACMSAIESVFDGCGFDFARCEFKFALL
jgi:hypothetical protein